MTNFDQLLSLENSIKDHLLCESTKLVREAIVRPKKNIRDLALLLSPAAADILEDLAEAASKIKNQRFGKTISLYAPLYISNTCSGDCPYCGFNRTKKITRKVLDLCEIERECESIKKSGMKHVLLVSGSLSSKVTISYIAEAISRLRRIVPSVSVEVPALSSDDYKILVEAGADGVVLYQETYNLDCYKKLHLRKPKSDFDYRLKALDRAGTAGFKKLTAGVLWGLSLWRNDTLRLGLHALMLQKSCWRSSVSIGLPRLSAVPSSFNIEHPLSDTCLVHIITALRIFLPDAGLVLSTRESAQLRDKLIRLGITQISAGSKTSPGGYLSNVKTNEQFPVTDNRSPKEVALELKKQGIDPVWKDWDVNL